jgi:hypothetical protein
MLTSGNADHAREEVFYFLEFGDSMSEPTDPIAQIAADLADQLLAHDDARCRCPTLEQCDAKKLEQIADALRAQRTEGRPMKFFVDGRGYDTTHPALNPMEIKQLAGVPLSDNLIAEGSIRQLMAEGKRLALPDEEPIDLTGEPKHFHSVPQAHD